MRRNHLAHCLVGLLAVALVPACLDVEAEGDYMLGGGPEVDQEDTSAEGTDEAPPEEEPAPEDEDTSSPPTEELIECDELEHRYLCPAGGTIEAQEGFAFCWFDRFEPPVTDELFAVCDELQNGTIGFGWPLEDRPIDVAYECPAGAEYSEDAEAFYCLWNDIELPPGSPTATCDNVTEGFIGFYFACEV